MVFSVLSVVVSAALHSGLTVIHYPLVFYREAFNEGIGNARETMLSYG